jgi:hypothetical protein
VLANASGSQVFLVDYRLAPSPYPGRSRTARGFRIVQLAPSFGVDPARIILGGDSAGGHLTITTARWLAARSVAGSAAATLSGDRCRMQMILCSFRRWLPPDGRPDGLVLGALATGHQRDVSRDRRTLICRPCSQTISAGCRRANVTAEHDVLRRGVAFRMPSCGQASQQSMSRVPGRSMASSAFAVLRQADAVLGAMAGS